MDDRIPDHDFKAGAERVLVQLETLDLLAGNRASERRRTEWSDVAGLFAQASFYAKGALEKLDEKLLEQPPEGFRPGDFYGTFTGLSFWPMDPKPEEIAIEDIALALANKPRFQGMTRRFYSVAEHSLRVAAVANALAFERHLPRALPVGAYALLHDANEAYLPDIPRPVKVFIPGWLAIEARVQAAIHERFLLPPPPAEVAEVVDDADDLLLAVEAHELFPAGHVTTVRIPAPRIESSVVEQALRAPYEAWRPAPPAPEDWDEVALLKMLRLILDDRERRAGEAAKASGKSSWKDDLASGSSEPPAHLAAELVDNFGEGARQALEDADPRAAELRGEPPAHLKKLLEG
jgi:hypothetical protein